ncbi:MAG: hypothetical protein CMM04_09285 [Rhodopirellula sp.]|nr:hypothetical protein [Rhodopirellula sp.]
MSKHNGALWLRGLTSLSDQVAESLSKHKGGEICLDGLSKLSDAAAESLGQYKGTLDLNNLKSLSDAAAMGLAKHEYRREELDLGNGHSIPSIIWSLGLSVINSLKASEGHIALCERLIQSQSAWFSHLNILSDEAAEVLARCEELVFEHGPDKLSDKGAQSLARKRPKLGPPLTRRKGGRINLDQLPASAAQILRDAGHG